VLTVGAAVHWEAARGIERIREVAAEGTSYVNLTGMWTFAGLLLLPPPLTAALVVIVYTHAWVRTSRRILLYRWAFSAATVILACGCGALILSAANPTGYPSFPTGPVGFIVLCTAGAAYWFVNYALVAGAILLSDPGAPGRRALGNASDQLLATGALGLGVALAGLLIHEPWSVAVLLLTVLGLHRGLLLAQFQTAANTDAKTGLASPTFWHEMARKELARAERTNKPLGILMIDLDRFKAVNDTHGHVAGDQVLKAVADTISSEVRDYDLVGRFGGEEFVVLLPATNTTNTTDTADTAERIRQRVAALTPTADTEHGRLTVDGLTCSIGAATYPTDGTTLEALLMAADTATYAAKAAGRNCVRTNGTDSAGRSLT
jgi:diguanylate cyclase (GGDEF)-like protein